MSATTTIKYTRHGGALLNYANSTKRKAHNGYDMPRVLALSASLGLTHEETEAKMKNIWKAKQTRERGEIEAYSVVQSFDPKQFDWKNEKDIKKVNELGNKFASRAYPGRLYTVSTQADNTHHVLHNHITICSQNPTTLKSLRGIQTRHAYVKQINDTILRENGYTPIKTQNLVKADSIAMRKMREKHPETHLKVDVIRDRLDKLMSRKDITSWDSLIEEAKKEKLDVRAKFNKQGTISRVSYKLLDDDENLKMQKGIRPKRLGEIYAKDNVEQFLQANSEFQKDRESNREAASRAIRGAATDFEANFERTIGKSPTVKDGRDRDSNYKSNQNTVEDPNRTRSPQTGFSSVTVYYPRSTSKRLRSSRNAFKRPRREDGQLSQPTNYSYPNFKQSTNNAKLTASEFEELKRDFKLLNSTPNTAKLWRNFVFDDDTIKELKQLFREYADITATPRVRERANRSLQADSRSHDDASDTIDFDF